MVDALGTDLTLMLPAFFWEWWALGKKNISVSIVIFILVMGLIKWMFFTLVLYARQKKNAEEQKRQFSANALMVQDWMCVEDHSSHISASSTFPHFIGLPNLDLSFEALLLAMPPKERLPFRMFVFPSYSEALTSRRGPKGPYPACIRVSLMLGSKRTFTVTRTRVGEGASPCLLLVWQDVTEQILARKEQAKKSQKLASEVRSLNQILDTLPWPLWVMDKSASHILYCNATFANALDLSKKEILRDAFTLGNEFKSHFSHGTQRYFNIKGARKYLELQEMPIESLQCILRFAFDKTGEEALTKKLEHYLALYREVLETLSAGVVIYDSNKRVAFHNHAYIRMFGMDEKWLNTAPTLGEVLDDLNRRRLLSDQADYPTYKKRENNMVSGLLAPFQELMHLPDQRTIRKITAPHPAGGIFYIFEDVTTSLELERRFNTHLQVRKSTLDNLYEGVAIFGSDNQLKFTNPAFCKLWAWAPSQEKEEPVHLSDLLEHAKNIVAYEGEWSDYKNRLIHKITDRMPKSRQISLKDKRFFDFSYTPLPDGSHLFAFHDVTSCVMRLKTVSTMAEDSPEKREAKA